MWRKRGKESRRGNERGDGLTVSGENGCVRVEDHLHKLFLIFSF